MSLKKMGSGLLWMCFIVAAWNGVLKIPTFHKWFLHDPLLVVTSGLFIILLSMELADRFRQRLKVRHKYQKVQQLYADELKRIGMPDRFAINSALLKLIETDGKDAEAAKVVMIYACSLPVVRDGVVAENFHNPKSNRDSINAFTNEMGNVNYQTDQPDQIKTSCNIQKDRIGAFRAWRPGVGVLMFEDFQKSELTTRANPLDVPEKHLLHFDEYMMLSFFGRIEIDDIKVKRMGAKTCWKYTEYCQVLHDPFKKSDVGTRFKLAHYSGIWW